MIESWTTMAQTPHPLTLAQLICTELKACSLMIDIYYDHWHFWSEYFVGISFLKVLLHHEHWSWFAMVETRHFIMTEHLYSDSINFGSVNMNPTTLIVVIFGYTIMGHVHCNVRCPLRCPLWCFQTEGSRKWQPQKIENHWIPEESEFGELTLGFEVFIFGYQILFPLEFSGPWKGDCQVIVRWLYKAVCNWLVDNAGRGMFAIKVTRWSPMVRGFASSQGLWAGHVPIEGQGTLLLLQSTFHARLFGAILCLCK